jgi:hypothetical protein
MKQKKAVMIVIIIVCLALAVAIAYKKEADYKKETSGPTGIETIDPNDMIWVKCANKECEAESMMGKKAYFKYLQDHPPTPAQFITMMTDPNQMSIPGLPCEQCDQEKIYRAEKCEKCDLIFIRGSVRHDFADRCTACDYSKTEELRRQARKAQKQQQTEQ